MAEIPNSSKILSPIAPPDDRDTFPTHFAKFGRGGYVSVNEVADIPAARLEEGMRAYEISSQKDYIYRGSVWEEIDLLQGAVDLFSIYSPNKWTTTEVKTAVNTGGSYVSYASENIPCDTSGGSFNVTLPALGNRRARIFDAVGNGETTGFGLNSLFVLPSAGTTVMGDTSFELDLGGAAFEFELIGTDWRVSGGMIPIQESYFSGDYSELTGKPTLGTAAATDTIDYATAAQGTLADSAVQPSQVREVLTANRTYYVRTDGNDSNDGLTNTAGGAFLTIQKAIDVVASLDISIYNAAIQVVDGIHEGSFTLKDPTGSGTCSIYGNLSNPENVVLGAICTASGTRRWVVENVTFKAGSSVINLFTGKLTLRNTRFTLDRVTVAAVTLGAVLDITGTLYIEGAHASNVFVVQSAASINMLALTITLGVDASITSGSFLNARTAGIAVIRTTTVSGTMSGGTKYSAILNGIIDTAGTVTLPGDGAGTTSLGGQYL